MTKVINAEYLGDYKIKVSFDNGHNGIADILPLIQNDSRALMKSLSDKSVFADFKIDCNTVTWSNGVDISPDHLFDLTKH